MQYSWKKHCKRHVVTLKERNLLQIAVVYKKEKDPVTTNFDNNLGWAFILCGPNLQLLFVNHRNIQRKANVAQSKQAFTASPHQISPDRLQVHPPHTLSKFPLSFFVPFLIYFFFINYNLSFFLVVVIFFSRNATDKYEANYKHQPINISSRSTQPSARSLSLSQSEAMETRRSKAVRTLTIFLLLIHGAQSFYLPGVAPEDFIKVSSRSPTNLSFSFCFV